MCFVIVDYTTGGCTSSTAYTNAYAKYGMITHPLSLYFNTWFALNNIACFSGWIILLFGQMTFSIFTLRSKSSQTPTNLYFAIPRKSNYKKILIGNYKDFLTKVKRFFRKSISLMSKVNQRYTLTKIRVRSRMRNEVKQNA